MTRLVPAALTLVAALAHAPDADAKAYYASLDEVEQQVEAVAIVDAASVSAVDVLGEHWVYNEQVDGIVVDVVAGTLPRRLEILGGRSFICAPVNWDKGKRYLALLVHEGERWTTANNEWGRIEIIGGAVDWPYDDSDALVPVDEITRRLESLLESRLGRGRFVDEPIAVESIEPEIVAATPPQEPTPPETSSPAPWIALGAAAVVFGLAVGTRRRR